MVMLYITKRIIENKNLSIQTNFCSDLQANLGRDDDFYNWQRGKNGNSFSNSERVNQLYCKYSR